MIIGYFLPASKLGGLTTHPWTRVPLVDVYQISSSVPSFLPESTSSFTRVSCVMLFGVLRSQRTTSGGRCADVRALATLPVLEIVPNERRCWPLVTARSTPARVA